MSIGDVVEFIGIETPVKIVVSDILDAWFVEVTYFDKDNVIRKEKILRSLLRIWKQKEITSGENA